MMKRSSVPQKILVNLDGPDGNAFYLIGLARQLCKTAKHLNLDGDAVEAEMREGDYIRLLLTFEKYFGQIVALETDNESYLEAFGIIA